MFQGVNVVPLWINNCPTEGGAIEFKPNLRIIDDERTLDANVKLFRDVPVDSMVGFIVIKLVYKAGNQVEK